MVTLSIIIPIFNVEKYLDECLRSIVGIDDIEIILVDDCTPDNSIKIVQSYMEVYNNIKLIQHSENKGLGAARNTGIDNASGKYIFFLDSDDHLDTNKLKSLTKALREAEHEQVVVSFLRFDEDQGIWPESYTHFYTKYNNKVVNKSNFRALINLINISPIRIIKREKILSDDILFQNGFYEDVMWSYWFSYSCKSTLVIDNRIYYYRQHPRSILGSTSSRHMELIEQQRKTLELFKSKSAPSAIIDIIKNQMLAHSKYVLFKTERIPKDLQREFCEQMINNLQSLLIDREEVLQKSLKELISIKFIYHPIKKYRQYKNLLKTCYNTK